jgi:thiamine biosynthesis lipoprotein
VDAEYERRFDLFGSRVRVLIGAPSNPRGETPEIAGLKIERLLRKLHAELSRFDLDSGLSTFNGDPRERVAVEPSVAMLVAAGIEAASTSGGLVDAAVIGPLEDAGYAESRNGAKPASLADALAWAPSRRPAIAAEARPWEHISVNAASGEVIRPVGVRIDSGGLGKGLAADLAARHLTGFSSFALDCGGDLRIGGAAELPRRVEVQIPLTAGATSSFEVVAGGVATSGLRSRIWKQGAGYSHHLIDPGRGLPAWTGVVQATALATTATKAEVLAKTAMLSGPQRARELLEPEGGAIVLDSGEVQVIGDVPTWTGAAPEVVAVGAP